MLNKKKRALALFISVVYGGGISFAKAQESNAIDNDNFHKKEEREIDRILVVGHTENYQIQETNTATKLPLSLKETPHSLTAFTRQRIEDFNLINVNEIMAQTPGITLQSYDSNRTIFKSRGFSVNNFQLDGIPSNFTTGDIVSDTSVYERVEVVRGAAGLVTGTGDASATVNMVRKRPTYDFAANVNLTYGSWDFKRTEIDVGGPLLENGNLRGRLVAAYTDSDSYVDRQNDTSPSVYGVLEADLTNTTRIRVGIDHLQTDSKGGAWSSTPLFFTDGSKTNISRAWSGAATWNRWERENTNTFVVAEQDFGEWVGRFAYNKRWTDTESLLLAGSNSSSFANKETGLGLKLFDTYSIHEIEEESFDGFLTGSLSLFDREHELVFGINSYNQQNDTLATNKERHYNQPTSGNTIYFPSIYGWDGDIEKPTVSSRGFPSNTVKNEQSGAYGAIRINPIDNLKIIIGGRYTDTSTETLKFSTSTDEMLAGSLTSVVEVSDNKLTPYAGVIYDLTPTVSLFSSYAQLFKPQSQTDINDVQLDPLTATSIEFGVKGDLFNETLYVSFSGFNMRQDNVAERIDSADPREDGSYPYREVDGINTWGGELEITGAITPNWHVTGGYSYARSEDAEDKRFSTETPLHLLKINTTYKMNKWIFGGGFTMQSKIARDMNLPTGEFNDDGSTIKTPGQAIQGGYTLLDLMARYYISPKLSLSANITNALDKKYYRNVGFFGGGYYGQPSRILASLRWNY